MEDKSQIDAHKYDNHNSVKDHKTTHRRGFLQLATVAATSISMYTVQSKSAQATMSEYGAGGYGKGPYGGEGFSVATGGTTEIDTASATVNGELTNLNGADYADCYFDYRKTGENTWSSTQVYSLSTTDNYDEILNELDGGAEYEYRSVGEASNGETAIGQASTFTVQGESAQATMSEYGAGGYGKGPYGGEGFSVATGGATEIDTASATVNGELTNLNGADYADCYFDYRKTGENTWSSTQVYSLSTTDSYDEILNELDGGAEYEYRSVGEASNGETAIGQASTFNTLDQQVIVNTASPSDITESSAVLNGSLSDLGGSASVECYFEWKQVGADTWNVTSRQSLASTGSFSIDSSSYQDGTEYVYRAIAEAGDGDSRTGDKVMFTTNNVNAKPIINRFSVSEAGRPNPHAEITAVWDVSDEDGDLASVEVEVTDENGPIQGVTWTVSGKNASDVDSFKIKNTDNSEFDVQITVVDGGGNRELATKTVVE